MIDVAEFVVRVQKLERDNRRRLSSRRSMRRVAAADNQGMHAVSGHIRTAVAKLRERPDADYKNAMKEATLRGGVRSEVGHWNRRRGPEAPPQGLGSACAHPRGASRWSPEAYTGMQATKAGCDTRPWKIAR